MMRNEYHGMAVGNSLGAWTLDMVRDFERWTIPMLLHAYPRPGPLHLSRTDPGKWRQSRYVPSKAGHREPLPRCAQGPLACIVGEYFTLPRWWLLAADDKLPKLLVT